MQAQGAWPAHAEHLRDLRHGPLTALQRLQEARWTGARRGGSPSPSSARTMRTRRADTSGGRSDHSARSEPPRRRRSSHPARPPFGARRRSAASLISAPSPARSASSGGRRAASTHDPAAQEPRLETGWQHRRQRRTDRCSVVDGDLGREDEQLAGEHRFRHDRLDILQLCPGLRFTIEEVSECQAPSVWHQQQRARRDITEGGGQKVREGALGSVGDGLDRDAHRAAAGGHLGILRLAGGGEGRGEPRPG